jgi:hypothetical protein
MRRMGYERISIFECVERLCIRPLLAVESWGIVMTGREILMLSICLLLPVFPQNVKLDTAASTTPLDCELYHYVKNCPKEEYLSRVWLAFHSFHH